ncbi:MAG: cell wall hydrolase [Candidatus Omnitrophota bacterium]|jgi:spore germination cell wall hydrolase CwlJ-like protein
MRTEDKTFFYALSDLDAMALTVYAEARGEPWEGKLAVGFIIVNRSRLWKKSIKDVCYQKNQFSCYNSNDKQYDHIVSKAKYWNRDDENDFILVAQTALHGWQESIISDATFYKVTGTKNKWFDGSIKNGKLIMVCEIGHHQFFKEAL